MQVVPFSPFAGLLEWVEQTIPLSDFLLGANKAGGAHGRFHPKEWTFTQSLKKLMKAAPDKKLDTFKTVSPSCYSMSSMTGDHILLGAPVRGGN